jgi:LysM repeat protein
LEQQNAHDQAEQLRKQVEDWKQQIDKQDALSLPPRSEVHKQKQKKKKTKWKMKYPVIRLLTLFFILLPVSILSIYYLNDKQSLHVVTLQPQPSNNSYEPIDIANQEEEEKPPVKAETNEQHIAPNVMSSHKSRVKAETNKQHASSNDEANEKSKQKVITHIVKENETLFSIAMQYYETDEGMDIIKKWNHLKNSQLHKGQVLQIPMVDLSK